MRSAPLLLVLVACGADDHRRTADSTQELVIPSLDAGPSPLETATAEPAERPSKPTPVAAMPADLRDPRAKTTFQSRDSLDAEVRRVEALLATAPPPTPPPATPPTSASARPLLLKRAAAAYAEIARRTSGAEAVAARQREAAHWATLIRDHPAFAGLDEARYFRGLALELAGDLAKARSSYYDLIKSHPQSRYVPYAYFAFGQMFFDEARQDPTKYALAEQALTEALKYPPPGNGVYTLALLRLGETELALNQPDRAKVRFERLRREFPTSPAAAHIPP